MDLPKDENIFLPKEPLELPERTMSDAKDVQPQQSQYAVRTLLSWSAPGRPFQRRNKEYFLNILVIALLFEVILFLFGQYLLMILVVALIFLAYALNTVPPHDYHYKITSEGIMIENDFFLWQELYDFYFKKQSGEITLVVGTKTFFPGELTLVLSTMHPEHLRDVLLPYLPFREVVKPTFMEKAAHWLEKNFPLDRQHRPKSS